MAEEVGIVMSLYDRVSPTLKAIAGNEYPLQSDGTNSYGRPGGGHGGRSQ